MTKTVFVSIISTVKVTISAKIILTSALKAKKILNWISKVSDPNAHVKHYSRIIYEKDS